MTHQLFVIFSFWCKACLGFSFFIRFLGHYSRREDKIYRFSSPQRAVYLLPGQSSHLVKPEPKSSNGTFPADSNSPVKLSLGQHKGLRDFVNSFVWRGFSVIWKLSPSTWGWGFQSSFFPLRTKRDWFKTIIERWFLTLLKLWHFCQWLSKIWYEKELCKSKKEKKSLKDVKNHLTGLDEDDHKPYIFARRNR